MNYSYFKRYIIFCAAVVLFTACQDDTRDNNLKPDLTPTALLSGVGGCESHRETLLSAGYSDNDRLEVEVSEGRVTFTHSAATYNCCMENVSLEIEQEGTVIKILEIEHAPNPCYCVCDYNIYGEIADLEPGTYEIAVCSQKNKDVILCSATVHVP